MKKRVPFFLISVVLMLLTTLNPIPSSLAQRQNAPYWPTDGWQTSTPEEQGMDSAQLADILALIKEHNYPIHNMVVIHNGYKVLDVNVHPAPSHERHVLYSTTKSVTSVLVGIAMQEGYLAGVDQPVLDFFPDRTFEKVDENKQAMTLEHLLTMTSGFDWPDEPTFSLSREMEQTGDWVQFIMDRPMTTALPGEKFNYHNGCSHLLMNVVGIVTGINPRDYAQQKLFDPLGISDVVWPTDPQGIPIGYSDLQLTPHDLAKIGYLYLNDGIWDGQPIVSPDWITASTTKQADLPDYMDLDYGYLWWVQPGTNTFISIGAFGQVMMVAPDHDVILVFTSAFAGGAEREPFWLIFQTIIDSIQSDDALPANPDAVAKLNALAAELANPTANPIPELPEGASTIDGVTYVLDENDLGWEALSLTFVETEAQLAIRIDDTVIDLPVGLDGVYRTSAVEGDTVLTTSFLGRYQPRNGPLALVGYWDEDETFVVNMRILGFAEGIEVHFTFVDDAVDARVKRHMINSGVILHGTAE